MLPILTLVILASGIAVGMFAFSPPPLDEDANDNSPENSIIAEYASGFPEYDFGHHLRQDIIDGFALNGKSAVEDARQVYFLDKLVYSTQIDFIVNGSAFDYDTDFLNSAESAKVSEYAACFNDSSLQNAIEDGFAHNGKTPFQNAAQVDFLETFPLTVQTELIANDSAYDIDWDKDNQSNRFEQVAGMPWNVHNGRYALIVDTSNDDYLVQPDDYLEDFLIKHEHFKSSFVIKLSNENATKERFDESISYLSKRVGENDLFCAFFRGHGDAGDGGEPFFIFNDGNGNNENKAEKRTYADIAAQLHSINSGKNLITFIDCGAHLRTDVLGDKESTIALARFAPEWIYLLSRDYDHANLGRDYAPCPELYPNAGGYVSISSVISVAIEYKGEGNYGPTVINNDNIEIWLGDFNLNDRAISSDDILPTLSTRPAK